MADTNVVGSLFGVTPELLQQQQQAQAMAAANNYAQLSPMQQAQQAMYMAGHQGGNAAAGLLGAEDPQLKAAKTAHELAQQFDITNPKGLMDYAGALQKAGLTQFAAMATDRAQQMLKTNAEIGQKTGENMNTLISSGKYTPESLGKYRVSRDPSDLQLIDKGLTGSVLEKVASAEQNISNLSSGNAEIDSWLTKVDPANPKVTFGIGSTIGAGASNLIGNPTENAQEQAKLRRFIAREANAILVAAKGTQTEGDAQRAYDMIMSGLDKNSNEGVYGALTDLKDMKSNTVKGLQTYVGTIKGKGAVPSAPQAAPASTGKYAEDYAKYKQKYGAQALPYEAYERQREKKASN